MFRVVSHRTLMLSGEYAALIGARSTVAEAQRFRSDAIRRMVNLEYLPDVSFRYEMASGLDLPVLSLALIQDFRSPKRL